MKELTPAVGRRRAEPCGPHPLPDNAVAHIGVPEALGLGHAAASGPVATDSARTARQAALSWRRIEDAVSPIIGIRGVGAIYGRSLSSARRACPWLPAVDRFPSSRIDLATLTEALAGQPAVEASLADALLRQSFGELLASLVGPRLAHQLLGGPFEASAANRPQGESPG